MGEITSAGKYLINSIPGAKQEDIVKCNGKWIHYTCHWKHKTADEKPLDSNFTALINSETLKVYNSDDYSDLRAKFSVLTLATPLYMLVKTIYHILFPLSLSYQICKTVSETKKEQVEAKKKNTDAPKIDLSSRIIKVIAKNFFDIIKTPLYMITMTIIALSTVIFSAFKSEFLYQGRVFYGEMLQSLNWGEKTTIWTYAPCMQPLADLKKREEKKYYVEEDTQYDGEPGTKIHALNNLARSMSTSKSRVDLCPCLD